jgi:hypothetical protein
MKYTMNILLAIVREKAKIASAQTVISAKVLNVLAMDRISVKTPNRKCRLS